MNKKFKMMLSLILVMSFFTFFSVCAVGVETDGNGGMGQAAKISVNSTVTGSMDDVTASHDTDVDYYKFIIDNDGYVSITIDHRYVASDSLYARIYLRNSSDTQIMYLSSLYENTTKTSGKIGLKAGVYYVSVEGIWGTSGEYNLTVNYTAADDWEKEFNDQITTADEIDINQTYYGSLATISYSYYNYDTDYFKFEIPSDGYITVTINHKYSDSTSTFAKLEVLSYDGTDTSKYLSFSSGLQNENVTSLRTGLSAGVYYMKIEQSSGSHREYNFKVNFTASNNWEINPNDNMGTATPINAGKTYYGSLADNDIDTYSFNLSKDGYVSVTFNHAYSDSASTFANITIYSYDGTNSKNLITFTSAGQNETVKSEKQMLTAGKYYLKISEYSAVNQEYNFSIDFTTQVETTTRIVTQSHQDIHGDDGYKSGYENSPDADYDDDFEFVYGDNESESEKGFFDAADVSSKRSILPLLIAAIVVGVATITVIVIFLVKQKKK